MQFSLMHKNIELLDFEYNDILNKIVGIKNVKEISHLPLFLQNENFIKLNQNICLQQINMWWQERSIPKSRQNLRLALQKLNISTPVELLTKSFGLSLVDCYWAKPKELEVSWETVNFFDNPFSEYIGKALFDNENYENAQVRDFYTPEGSSTGWLAKKWVIDSNGTRVLYKSGSAPFQLEPFNEVIASQIARKLNFDCVPYKIAKKNNNYFSVCPNMLKKDEELISALEVMSIQNRDNNTSYFTHFLNCVEKLGGQVERIEKDASNMILLDFIISNTDRHFNNFGVIRDANTLEIKKLAPIYDSGTSLFHNSPICDLKNIYNLNPKNIEAKGFKTNQAAQIRVSRVVQNCKNIDLSKLKNIETLGHNILLYNKKITEEHRELLCKILKVKTKEIECLIRPNITINRKFDDYNLSL